MKYKYKYIMRFNAIKNSFDGLEKFVQTYHIVFLVEQDNTSYKEVENFLKSVIGQYKGKDLDELKGKHFTLEDIGKEIYEQVSKTDLLLLKKLEISNSMVTTYILEGGK